MARLVPFFLILKEIITGFQYISLAAKSARSFMLELYLYFSIQAIISGGKQASLVVVNMIF